MYVYIYIYIYTHARQVPHVEAIGLTSPVAGELLDDVLYVCM